MQKKGPIAAIILIVIILAGSIGYLYLNLQEEKQNNEDLKQLAALDKKEMENEYAKFALEYDELKKSIKDDSLMLALEKEQKRAQDLLKELKQVKSTDAAEIKRLKKELATVRAVLRSYIIQVDSLQQLNESLMAERDQVKKKYNQATNRINDLKTEKETLSETVAIASQLDATNIQLEPQKKNHKFAKKSKDITRFVTNFLITKNITAQTGNRTIYVRITKPNNEVIGKIGHFKYENTELEYSAVKNVEYTGEELPVTMYIPVNEYLSAGKYSIYIFAEGTMIGAAYIVMEK